MPDLVTLLRDGSTNLWLFVPTAIILGALHGLEPGHSKTMMAAFIIAVRGTVGQAILLGLSATLSHTLIVWLVALLGLHFGSAYATEAVEPWLQLVSGIIIIAIALWMMRQTFAEHHHHHSHDHDHHHDHHHDHDHDHDHHHHDHHHHDNHNPHDVNRHDAHIRAFCLTTDDAIPSSAFELFLTLLKSAHGEKLLRMKGIVKIAEHPDCPVILHGVQHVFHPPVQLARWPDGDHQTKMVFITKDLDESFVSRLWEAFLDRPGIDTPDRSAMLDNPLSLRRE